MEPILMAEMNDEQKQVLTGALLAAQQAKQAVKQAEARVRELITMAKPVGADRFDLENFTFWADPVANPPAPDVDSPEDETST